MSERLMMLPCNEVNKSRLIRIPDDYEEHEAYRKVTGVIANLEETSVDLEWDDIMCQLESFGFEQVEFVAGPQLHCK